ncbi:MAG TPA: AMP-binding protein [Methylibium sp.]|uniref:AMP-binding protein n=1 Tax=Methylibium sp. TaxID=2067992 RepID=UPI002DB5A81E|nr:AMP-binding protein [Methylibium sp.]HEU4459150.1 AMP-binding protein [Methylibium sp.]
MKLPLIVARDLDAPIAWRAGRPLIARCFLADAAHAAQRLPDRGAMLDLCSDRYAFAVGLAAAWMRGQAALLPPNALPDTLARLRAAHPELYVYGDGTHDPVADLGEIRHAEIGALAHETPTIDADQHAAILLTSGSTGTPQAHAKRWRTLVDNIAAAAERLAASLERPSLVGVNVVATVPPQHSYGFESSVLLGLLGGAAFDCGRPFYPADIVAALESLPRPRVLVTTPFHLKTLLRAGLALPPVDLLLSATAPLSPQLALEAERAFGGPLVEIYGCTEAGQVATRRSVHTEVWQCFGALRVRAELVDGVERFVAEGGHVAEPTPLADILAIEPGSGAEGDGRRFRLLGRSNDLIHVAGKRSSLAHLDYHLNSIEGVEDGAFWLPDEVADAVVRPVAFVVAPKLDAAAIVQALRGRLDAVFVPRRVVHVDALPRAATGKLAAAALARLAQERLG